MKKNRARDLPAPTDQLRPKPKPKTQFAFPRWSAPLVGAGVGAFLSLYAGLDDKHAFAWYWQLGFGGALGLVAGGIILILDPVHKRLPDEETNAYRDVNAPATSPPKESLGGRFFAVMGVLLFWVPIIGLPFGIAAVLSNRETKGWAYIVGWIGIGLSALMTAGFLFVMVMAMLE